MSNQLQQAASTQAAVSSLLALEADAAELNDAATNVAPPACDVDVLASRVALQIESLVPRGRARCIDLAPGAANLIEAIRARTERVEWHYADSRDGEPLPYADGEFDVALLCDVLHDEPDSAPRLLTEARRIANFVLVKDRFFDGARTRGTRPPADLLARPAHGVLVASRCFTRASFVRLATGQGLRVAALDANFDRYKNLPIIGPLLRPGGEFLALLSRV